MKSSYNGQAVPAGGQAIGYVGGELQVPDMPVIPVYRGRRHWAGHLEGLTTGV